MDVGDLIVRLKGDMSGLKSELDKSGKALDSLESKSNRTQIAVRSHFTSMGTAAASLSSTMGVAFGAAAIINFGKHVVNTAGQLADLSAQTGISAQLLSGLKSTLEENGTSVQAFATGIFRVQKELGDISTATDPALKAIKALGLNLNDLRNADTEEFLKKVTDSLGNIEDPFKRGALGAQLLGRQFRELAPAINEMAGRLAELKRQGMSDEDIARLDAAGDAWVRFGNNLVIVTGEFLAGAIRDFQEINRLIAMNITLMRQRFATGSAGGATGGFLGGMADIAPGLMKPKPKGKNDFQQPVDDATLKSIASFLTSIQKQADAMRVSIIELEKGSAAARELGLALEFAAFKQELLAQGKLIPADLEGKFKKAAASVMAMGDAFDTAKVKAEAYQRSMELIDTMAENRNKATSDFAQLLAQINFEKMSEGEKVLATINKQFDEMFIALMKVQEELIATGKLSQDMKDKLAGAMAGISKGRSLSDPSNPDRGLEKLQVDLDKAAQQAKIFGSSFDLAGAKLDAFKGFLQNLDPAIDLNSEKIQNAIANMEKWKDTVNVMNNVEQLIGSVGTGIHDTLVGIAQGTQTVSQGFKNMASNIARSVMEMVWKLTVIEPMLKAFKDAVSGGTGGIMGMDFDVLMKGMLGIKTAAKAPSAIGAGNPADAASAALQTQQAVSTAGIQGTVATAQAAIQGETAVATSAIDSVTAVAISTIQAALKAQEAAAAAGSSGGGGGSSLGIFGELFGGGTSGTGTDSGSYMQGGGLTDSMGYAAGGMVPGPSGKAQWAVVHGGEEVIPVGGKRSSTINQHFYISTPDAASFRQSQHEITTSMRAALMRGQNR